MQKLSIQVAQIILAIQIGLSGYMKIFADMAVDVATNFSYPLWFIYVIAGLELIGAALLLIGLFKPRAALIGSSIYLIVMIGAVLSHYFNGAALSDLFVPLVLASLAFTVVGFHYKTRHH